MIIWPGIELIGCPRGTGKKRGVVQGVIYTVVDMSEDNIFLKMRPEYCQRRGAYDDDDDEENAPAQISVPVHDVPSLLRLSHAMCYYTVQGRRFDLGRTTLLLDTEHPHFSRRALIVGMYRVRHGNDLHTSSPGYDGRVTGRTRTVFCRA